MQQQTAPTRRGIDTIPTEGKPLSSLYSGFNNVTSSRQLLAPNMNIIEELKPGSFYDQPKIPSPSNFYPPKQSIDEYAEKLLQKYQPRT